MSRNKITGKEAIIAFLIFISGATLIGNGFGGIGNQEYIEQIIKNTYLAQNILSILIGFFIIIVGFSLMKLIPLTSQYSSETK